MHDLQEANVLPGLSTLAFDFSAVFDSSSWYGAVLAGAFNITPAPSILETITWAAYAVPVLALFLWPARRSATPAPTKVEPATASPTA